MSPATGHMALVVACGPRPGGNSEACAELMARGIEEAGGRVARIFLRKTPLSPCLGCNACHPERSGRCIQEDVDLAESMFAELEAAPLVLFASPIYFYHVPALFKAFIDRTQPYWLRRQAGDERVLNLPPRKAYVAMVAGRPTGKSLFQGALLTLKYCLVNFNIQLAEPLLFRGVDEPGDLASDPEKVRRVMDYAGAAWRAAMG